MQIVWGSSLQHRPLQGIAGGFEGFPPPLGLAFSLFVRYGGRSDRTTYSPVQGNETRCCGGHQQ